MSKNYYIGILTGMGVLLILQALVLPCGLPCKSAFIRTAINDLENGGNWNKELWETIGKELSERKADE